ncbi:hypothetical protein OIU85_001476 [Salix viminalis]|uniref:RIN4 pathogenic type III effector avirulence factor Avr cleavage site domain-containing protein n=1 Tax=Salix viminalis TaxID=40686 RepID=A0A9Q0VLC5_SALVM|nr:hypothetical protein OIU85_001476 [Salix viminalis]
MERRRRNGGLSVPEFGGWNSKNTVPTDYSMVFTQARANRRQRKSDVRHASLGNERELLSAAAAARQQEDSVMKRKKFLTYINCCIRP